MIKTLISTLFIVLLTNINGYGQSTTYEYFSGSDEDGMSETVELTLNKNKTFVYKFIDDQACYENYYISFGEWQLKKDSLFLKVSDSLKPKITLKKQGLKQDTLTIIFNRANEKAFFDNGDHYNSSDSPKFNKDKKFIFYDKQNKEIDIYYDRRGVVEIPKKLEIERIEMFVPNANHKDNYLEVVIPKNTGQIIIDNLSHYLITDFERYTFVLKKNNIIMVYKNNPLWQYTLNKVKND